MMMNGFLKKFPEMLNDLCSRFQTLKNKDTDRFIELPVEPDMRVLNSRVQLSKQKSDGDIDVFNVQICGSINAPKDAIEDGCTKLRISILDVTDGRVKSKPLLAANKQWSSCEQNESSVFYYDTDLGKILHKVTVISDWITIARLPIDWLMFPRKGQRRLQFEILVLAIDCEHELARAQNTLTYTNTTTGYMDIQESIERTKTLTVALAFAVAAADSNIYNCEIELIRRWVKNNFGENLKRFSEKAMKKLDKALDKTAAFFRDGHRLNVHAICRDISEIASIGQRYDVLELCLHVAQVKGYVTSEELSLLNNIVKWLNVNTDKSRLMIQKILPVNIHEVMDVETILGITSDMSKEKARKQLNIEYRKWNSRVTHTDPHIQTQVDQMLQLIAQARNQYILKQDNTF